MFLQKSPVLRCWVSMVCLGAPLGQSRRFDGSLRLPINPSSVGEGVTLGRSFFASSLMAQDSSPQERFSVLGIPNIATNRPAPKWRGNITNESPSHDQTGDTQLVRMLSGWADARCQLHVALQHSACARPHTPSTNIPRIPANSPGLEIIAECPDSTENSPSVPPNGSVSASPATTRSRT